MLGSQISLPSFPMKHRCDPLVQGTLRDNAVLRLRARTLGVKANSSGQSAHHSILVAI